MARHSGTSETSLPLPFPLPCSPNCTRHPRNPTCVLLLVFALGCAFPPCADVTYQRKPHWGPKAILPASVS